MLIVNLEDLLHTDSVDAKAANKTLEEVRPDFAALDFNWFQLSEFNVDFLLVKHWFVSFGLNLSIGSSGAGGSECNLSSQ